MKFKKVNAIPLKKAAAEREREWEPKTNLPEIEKYLPTHKQVKECCLLQQK